MKRILRLTESELTNVIKRIVNEGVETTKMTPIVTKELPLVNEPGGHNGLAISGEKEPNGTTKYYDITVKGYYSHDPKKGDGVQDKNFVTVTISIAPKLHTTITYNCANKKVVSTGGEVSGNLPSRMGSVRLLQPNEGKGRIFKDSNPDNYGNVLYDKTKYISTTSGPVAQVIQHYCRPK